MRASTASGSPPASASRRAPLGRPRRGAAGACECAAARRPFEAADIGGRGGVAVDRQVPDLAGAAVGAAQQLAPDHDPGADPDAEVHVDGGVQVGGGALPAFADHGQVDLVLRDHRASQRSGERLGERCVRPARDLRRQRDLAAQRLDHARRPDYRRPRPPAAAARVGCDLLRRVDELAEHALAGRTPAARRGEHPRGQLAAPEVGGEDEDLVGADVHAEHEAAVRAEPEAPRRAAGAARLRRVSAVLLEDVAVDQLVADLAHGGLRQPGHRDQLRPRRSAVRAERAEDACSVDPANQRRRVDDGGKRRGHAQKFDWLAT